MFDFDWDKVETYEVFEALYPDAAVGDIFTMNENSNWLYVYLGKFERCPEIGELVLSTDAKKFLATYYKRYVEGCDTTRSAFNLVEQALKSARKSESASEQPCMLPLYRAIARRGSTGRQSVTYRTIDTTVDALIFNLGHRTYRSSVLASSRITKSNAKCGKGIQLHRKDNGDLMRVILPQEITLAPSDISNFLSWDENRARNELAVMEAFRERQRQEWLASEEYKEIIAGGSETGFTVNDDDVLF